MKTQPIQVSAQGPSVVLPGVSGKIIRVMAFSLSALPLDDQLPTFSLVKWQSIAPGTNAATDLTGYRALNQYGLSWDMPMCSMRLARPDAYMETNPGEGLALYEQDAFDLGGFVCYEYQLV